MKGCLLVSMPWMDIGVPSIGASILKARLQSSGVDCRVINAPMQLLRHMKFRTYNFISTCHPVNDFAFTREFEAGVSDEQKSLLYRIAHDPQRAVEAYKRVIMDVSAEVEMHIRVRQEIIPRFLDDLMQDIEFDRYTLVGFVCSCDQTFASLALARRIRRAYPELTIAFGGYALARPIGPALQRAFPEMDVVAYGDGEPVIYPLWQAACGDRPLSDVPNITYRDDSGEIRDSQTTLVTELDASPTPNYDDFLRDIEKMRREHKITIVVKEIPVESSRGCWWGERSHCLFCGLNEQTIQYRLKSADVVLKQLDELHERYGVITFRFSDNIMPMQNFHDLFPMLSRREKPYRIEYETKANLTGPQIRQAAEAGVFAMQPGIESFSTSILGRMRKGVSGIQNVFTVYTMMRYGISCLYNLLYDVPGETASECRALIRLLPSLYHLVPPFQINCARAVRNAPLLKRAEEFGYVCEPHWRYDLVLTPAYRKQVGVETSDFAYYFTDWISPDPEVCILHETLQHQYLTWKKRFEEKKVYLIHSMDNGGITVRDTRFGDEEQVYQFGSLHREICDYMLTCDTVCPQEALVRELSGRNGKAQPIRNALNELCDARIVINENGRYVWIAFDESAYAPEALQWGKAEAFVAVARNDNATIRR